MSFRKWMDKQMWYIQTIEYYLVLKKKRKKKWAIKLWKDMEETEMCIIKWKEANLRKPYTDDFNYMTF